MNPANFSFLIAIMCLFQLFYQFWLYPRLGPPLGKFTHLQMFRLGCCFYIPSYMALPLLRAFASPDQSGGFFIMTCKLSSLPDRMKDELIRGSADDGHVSVACVQIHPFYCAEDVLTSQGRPILRRYPSIHIRDGPGQRHVAATRRRISERSCPINSICRQILRTSHRRRTMVFQHQR